MLRATPFLVAAFLVSACGSQESPAPPAPVDQTAVSGTFPSYTVADIVEEIGGTTYAEVIVPSLSPDTSAVLLEGTARLIAQREGADNVGLYATDEARQANMSASFAESHPGALEAGYLGELRDGAFTLPVR